MDPTLLSRALGDGSNTIAKGVARLYRGEKNKWVPIDAGLLVWHRDADGFQWLKLLRTSDGKVLLDEELYENFEQTYKVEKTRNGTHAVHIFELEHDVLRAATRTQTSFIARAHRVCSRPAVDRSSPRASRARRTRASSPTGCG